jgi:LacI family transcriptional regulator
MHVTGNLTQSVHMERFNGFKQALGDLNLPFSNDQLLVTDLSEIAGVDVARHILEMDLRPDGVFILDDLCAVSCMLTLKQHNVYVPEEIAIVGSNNDAVSRVVEPKLSTISFAGCEMGEVAAMNLINQLSWSSRLDARYKIVLPSELIIRGSSKRKDDCHSSSGLMLQAEGNSSDNKS